MGQCGETPNTAEIGGNLSTIICFVPSCEAGTKSPGAQGDWEPLCLGALLRGAMSDVAS
jgi:hypothetical protein